MIPGRRRAGPPRRALLGLGTIGALLALLRPTRPVAAGFGDPLRAGILNTAPVRTRLRCWTEQAGLHIQSKFHQGSALRARGSQPGGAGVVALGGSHADGAAGVGMTSVGGESVNGAGGEGLRAQGGDSQSSTGGIGAEIFGFDSGAESCGRGVIAFGGAGGADQGGAGVSGQGGAGGTGDGGPGIIAVGGHANREDGGPAAGLVAYGGEPSDSDPSGVGGYGVVGTGGVMGHVEHGVAGLRGENTGTGPGLVGDGLKDGVGVRGLSESAAGGSFEGGVAGAIGLSAAGPGAQGFSKTGPGVGGGALAGSSVGGVGIVGTSASGHGGLVQANAKDQFACQVVNIGAGSNPDALGVLVNGDWVVQNATKSAAVPTSRGLVLLYAVEGPVALLEDVGIARLVSGRARVELDPLFAETIETDDYHVFTSPHGDSLGVYVASQDARGFELREQQGGTSAFEVSYRVVAKRTGLRSGHRLATLPRFPAPPPPELPRGRPAARAPLPPVAVPPRPKRPAPSQRPRPPARSAGASR
jgi:hypothetical protein